MTNLILYIISFVTIWWGAGLIIQSVDKIARRFKLSTFAFSFFILGLFTSIPETAVSINAVSEHNPEIFVGTFIGGVVVIFLLIIPILAILGRGIRITHELDRNTLLFALTVISLPSLLVIDHKVNNIEGLILIAFYLVLFYLIQKKHGIFDTEKTEALQIKAYTFLDLLKVIFGVIVVFFSSSFIVDQTIFFSQILMIPAFYISLLALGLGTNLPELSIAIRAILAGKKDIAFGDYLGSASANAFLFGLFTLINEGEVITTNNFLITFGFIFMGLALFYYFSQSKKDISMKEGVVLLSVYIIFVIYELWKSMLF